MLLPNTLSDKKTFLFVALAPILMVIIRQRPRPGARRQWIAADPQVAGTAAEGTTQAQRSWPFNAPP